MYEYWWGAKAWPTLRDVFSKEKASRGFDINLAVKASRGGWLLGALVGFGLQPFYPPTARLGMAGWGVVAALAISTGVWIHTLMRRPERVTRNTLLLTAYLGHVGGRPRGRGGPRSVRAQEPGR